MTDKDLRNLLGVATILVILVAILRLVDLIAHF